MLGCILKLIPTKDGQSLQCVRDKNVPSRIVDPEVARTIYSEKPHDYSQSGKSLKDARDFSC